MRDVRRECIEWMMKTPSNKRDNYPPEYEKFLNCCKNTWFDNPQSMMEWYEKYLKRKPRGRLFNRDKELAFKIIYYGYSQCGCEDASKAPFIIDQKSDTVYVRRQKDGNTELIDNINALLPKGYRKFEEGSGFGLKDNNGRKFEHDFVKYLWCLTRGEQCNLISEKLKMNFENIFKVIIKKVRGDGRK